MCFQGKGLVVAQKLGLDNLNKALWEPVWEDESQQAARWICRVDHVSVVG